MTSFFKEEIKELLYIPTIKLKKKYSIVIEKIYDIADISNNCISNNKLLLLEVFINSQKKKELHIRQYNQYKIGNDSFAFSNKSPDFNIEINKVVNGKWGGIYSLCDLIFNIFIRENPYNMYILKNNKVFNKYFNLNSNDINSVNQKFKTLLYNYLLLIINNKE